MRPVDPAGRVALPVTPEWDITGFLKTGWRIHLPELMPLNTLPLALGLVMAFSWGTSDFLSKGASARIGPYWVSIFVLVLSGLACLPLALVLKSSLAVSPTLAVLLVLLAIVTFLGLASLYGAYSRGMLSLTAPIANSYPAFAVIASVAFIGARFSSAAILALLLTLAGIVLVSTSLSDLGKMVSTRRHPFLPGMGPAFVAAIFIGLSFTIFGYASERLGYLLPIVTVRFGAAAVGLALIPLIRPGPAPSRKRLPRVVPLMAVLETAGLVAFNYGVFTLTSPTTVPLLATFGGMAAAVTVAYAIVFLKERLEINHIVGVIALISGVVALIYLTS